MRNMLEYINTGTTNDFATKSLDEEVKEARLKEEWRAEYMLTLVHDKDMFREGYNSRQAEIDAMTSNYESTIADKDAKINQLLKELEEYKNHSNKSNT